MPTRFVKFISGKHFSKLFLLLYTLFMCFAAYETDAALCLLTQKQHLYGAVYIAFGIVAVLVVFKKKIESKWKNRAFKKTLSFLSCFFIYYILILTTWEIVCFIFSIDEAVKGVGVVCSIVLAVLMVLVGYSKTKFINTKSYEIKLGSGDSEYHIVLLSDIHLGVFVGEKHISRIVRKVNELLPDLVVISGDIFDTDNSMLSHPDELKRISKQFCKIKAKEGVYAVVGNHDPEVDDKAFKRFLKASKIHLLHNDFKTLSMFNLIGRTDEVNSDRTEITDIIAGLESSKPIVVLDHKPENIEDAAKHGADLVLCGHTHKGQLFPITLFTRWANGKNCFYGYSVTGKTHSIITSGVGFFELPIRLGSSNEIVDICLLL